MDLARLLAPFLAAPLTSAQCDAISAYLDLLLRWNARTNLTAVRECNEIVTRHFGESLFAARHLLTPEARAHAVDVGSGAGFPGLPLKIYAPDLRLTLIESQNKKATFLKEVARTLALSGVEVFTGRAETYVDRCPALSPGWPTLSPAFGEGWDWEAEDTAQADSARLRRDDPGWNPQAGWKPRPLGRGNPDEQQPGASAPEHPVGCPTRADFAHVGTAHLVTLRAVERFESILPVAGALLQQMSSRASANTSERESRDLLFRSPDHPITQSPDLRLALLISAAQGDRARALLPHFAWDAPIPIPQSAARVLLVGHLLDQESRR